jgi:hypothetical protein
VPNVCVRVGNVKENEFLLSRTECKLLPILENASRPPDLGQNRDDPEKVKRLVRVKWAKADSKTEAVYELGFFGNQNTVARPRHQKWKYPVDRLKAKFGIE